MNITLLCSDPSHPIIAPLRAWQASLVEKHRITLIHDRADLPGGDLLFLISCAQKIEERYRKLYRHCLILHASDLPHGRGWSPHIWEVIGGSNKLTVCLLEAADAIDTGRIWSRRTVFLEGHELYDEINAKLFAAELSLMTQAIEETDRIQPQVQSPEGATWYRRRTPEDSRIDPGRSLAEQFSLLRVADPQRYPAFFDLMGFRYLIQISKQGRISS